MLRTSALLCTTALAFCLTVVPAQATAVAKSPVTTVNGHQCSIVGTNKADVLTGTPGADIICGLGGDDTIDGRGGNDIILAGLGDDEVLGGHGHDTIHADGGNDLAVGGPGNDTMRGTFGRNRLLGGSGSDTITGGTQVDVVLGGPGKDTINGSSGNDTIKGGAGDDVMDGWLGDDSVTGQSGRDEVRGYRGVDTLHGGSAGDWLIGERGTDGFDGASGSNGCDAVDSDIQQNCRNDTRAPRILGGDGGGEMVPYSTGEGNRAVPDYYSNGGGFTLRLADDTGIYAVEAWLQGEEQGEKGKGSLGRITRVSGNLNDGVWQTAEASVGKYAWSGSYDVHVKVTDLAGKTTTQVFPGRFTLNNPNENRGPVVRDLRVHGLGPDGTVDSSQGALLRIEFDLYDAAGIHKQLSSMFVLGDKQPDSSYPWNVIGHRYLTLDSGDEVRGTYSAIVDVPAGTPKGEYWIETMLTDYEQRKITYSKPGRGQAYPSDAWRITVK